MLAPEFDRGQSLLACQEAVQDVCSDGMSISSGSLRIGEFARRFEAEFGSEPGVQHCTFAWDRVDGKFGRAEEEFVSRGYELEETVGLVATPDSVRSHQRENREVTVRTLDPLPAADRELWDQVLELQVTARDRRFEEQMHRGFSRHRLEDLRALFRAGRGAWFVAVDPGGREVQASCGVVVAGTRGRFQAVDTAEAHRRKGMGAGPLEGLMRVPG
jgi:hypothetical protein